MIISSLLVLGIFIILIGIAVYVEFKVLPSHIVPSEIDEKVEK